MLPILSTYFGFVDYLNLFPSLTSNRPRLPEFTPRVIFFVIVCMFTAWPVPLSSEPVFPEGASTSNLPIWLYESYKPTGDIRRFAGETLKFNIDFMIFSHAAESQISLYEEDGKLKCVLIGETKGFVGFMTSYVKHVYRATFDILDGGNRLQTSLFEREVIVEDKRERIVHAMDYHSRRHHYFQYKNGKLINQRNDPLPEGDTIDDVLAAFYNFRNGVYGPVEKGMSHTVPTFQTKRLKEDWTSTMVIQTLTETARKAFEEDKKVRPGASMLINIKVPSDLFETKEGIIYFWSSSHLVPTQGIFKDFILFGDLDVTLTQRISRQDQRKRGVKGQ